jgi:hypothetical protein
MASPPMRISPESGTSSMLMQRSIVDLPEPEAPRIEITSPVRAESDTPFSTSSEPKLLRRFCTETAGVLLKPQTTRTTPLHVRRRGGRGLDEGPWRRCGESQYSSAAMTRVTRKFRMR